MSTPRIQRLLQKRFAKLNPRSSTSFAGEYDSIFAGDITLNPTQVAKMASVGMTEANIREFLADGAPPSDPVKLDQWVDDIVSSWRSAHPPMDYHPVATDFELDDSSKGFSGAATYTKTPESEAAYKAAKAQGLSDEQARAAANAALMKSQGDPVKWGEWSRGWRPGPLEILFGIIGLFAVGGTVINWTTPQTLPKHRLKAA